MNNQPIGFFDSGIGGISVLGRAVNMLPNESFIYYGDDLHIPYGEKEPNEINELTNRCVEQMISMGIKSLVIACNTATSIAVKGLRSKYDIPIIGMEPAVKPAVNGDKQGKIVVMATPRTIKADKFHKLYEAHRNLKEIIPLPSGGLVELIEQGEINHDAIIAYLKQLFLPITGDIGYIVLGCTHYVFVKPMIAELFPDVEILDGSLGAVKHLSNQLAKRNLLAEKSDISGYVRAMFTQENSFGEQHFRYYLDYIRSNI